MPPSPSGPKLAKRLALAPVASKERRQRPPAFSMIACAKSISAKLEPRLVVSYAISALTRSSAASLISALSVRRIADDVEEFATGVGIAPVIAQHAGRHHG